MSKQTLENELVFCTRHNISPAEIDQTIINLQLGLAVLCSRHCYDFKECIAEAYHDFETLGIRENAKNIIVNLIEQICGNNNTNDCPLWRFPPVRINPTGK